MAEKSDYARGYAKGRYAGERKSDERANKAEQVAAESVARAERAEAQQGFGKCIDCRNWTWGGNSALWGVCKPPEMRLHNREPLWFRSSGEFTTSRSFGCILFAKRA